MGKLQVRKVLCDIWENLGVGVRETWLLIGYNTYKASYQWFAFQFCTHLRCLALCCWSWALWTFLLSSGDECEALSAEGATGGRVFPSWFPCACLLLAPVVNSNQHVKDTQTQGCSHLSKFQQHPRRQICSKCQKHSPKQPLRMS